MEIENYLIDCPNCNGKVHRSFDFFSQLCYFLPLHFLFLPKFNCTACNSQFRAEFVATDYLIAVLFLPLHFFYADIYYFPLIFFVVGLFIFREFSKAGQMVWISYTVGTLWFLMLLAIGAGEVFNRLPGTIRDIVAAFIIFVLPLIPLALCALLLSLDRHFIRLIEIKNPWQNDLALEIEEIQKQSWNGNNENNNKKTYP